MSEFDYEKMSEALARALKASGTDGKAGTTGAVKPKDAKDLDVFIQHLKQMNSQANKWNDAFKKNIGQIAGVNENLNELDAAIEKTTDIYDKEQLAKKKEAVVRAATNAVLVKEAMSIATTFGTASKSIAAGAGKLTKDLLSGSSSVDFATGAMTAGLDIAGTASTQLGQASSTAGTMLMGAGGKAKALGFALTGVGGALGLLGASAGLLKFGVEVLGGEVTKTIKAFETITDSGVMYTKGMDDLLKYSGQAGLTMEQFSNVVKTNSAVLAESGYTVTDASKIVAGVAGNLATNIGKSGLTLRNELKNLGYGVEEQANLVAQLTGDLKKSGGTATNGQMAAATVELGKNMRIVSDLMGQDAKAKMEQSKKESEQYAFNAKIRELSKKYNDPGLMKRVQAGLSLMDDTQRRAAIQATVLGTVTDSAANVLGQRDAALSFAQNLESGGQTIEGLVGEFAKANTALSAGTNSTMQAISVANIATGTLGEFATSANSLGQQSFLVTTENLAKASKAAEEATNPASVLQKNVVMAADTMQKFQVDLQNMMLKPMEQFSEVMEKVLAQMRTAVGELTDQAKSAPSTWDKLSNNISEIGNDVTKMGIGAIALGGTMALAGTAMSLTGVGAAAGVPLAAAGGKLLSGGIAATGVGAGISLFGDTKGKANGGIASGPVSGYLEKLHGTELVVPLTAQGTIKEGTLGHTELLKIMNETAQISAPTANSNPSAPVVQPAADLGGLVTAMSALLSTARDQLDKQDEMLRVMADNRDNTERLYQAMS